MGRQAQAQARQAILKSCIYEAIEKQRDIASKGLRGQLRQLVLRPLLRLDGNFLG